MEILRQKPPFAKYTGPTPALSQGSPAVSVQVAAAIGAGGMVGTVLGVMVAGAGEVQATSIVQVSQARPDQR